MINSIDVHCLGESHKDSGKPCQDYSFSSVEEGMAIAVVCDGHGGERYFRSDQGARCATEVIVEVVRDFVAHTDSALFKGSAYTAEGVVTGNDKKLTPLDIKFRQMFSSIITQWNERIDKHAHECPLSEWEFDHVPQKYLIEFQKNLDVPPAESTLNKQYGCTLMAYVQTDSYWFAFHLGDGKCISFHKDVNFHGQNQIWDEPIPWDDRCFLNKTTSICDSDAINEFRYCYGNSTATPVAVFLGSDGIDDTYGEMENIANFYVEILKIIAKDGKSAALQQLKDDLPIISRIGSKDDASVAVVYNNISVVTYVGHFIKFQIDYMDAQAKEQAERIQTLLEKKHSLEHRVSVLDSDRKKVAIELNYALKDLTKAADRLEILGGKIDFLAKEFRAHTGTAIPDKVDYSEIIEQAKEAATMDEVPIPTEETAAEIDETPSADENLSVVEDASAVEEEPPAVEETSVAEESPVLEETPAVDEVPVLEETPASEESPTVESIPSADEI